MARRETSSYHGPRNFRGTGEFRDDSSYAFVKNEYIVYKNGLDGEKPNPIALAQANQIRNTMSFLSGNKLTGADYLFYFLKDLAARERKKENLYLDLKLAQLEQETPPSFKETGTLKALREIIKHLRADPSKSPNNDSISSAFTLLFNPTGYNELLKEIKNQSNGGGGVAHDNSFYRWMSTETFNEVFKKYEKKFYSLLRVHGESNDFVYRKNIGDLLDKLSNDFINEYLSKLVNKFSDTLIDRTATFEKMKADLLTRFRNQGFILGDIPTSKITGKSLVTKRKKFNTLTKEEQDLVKSLSKDYVNVKTPIRGDDRSLSTIMRGLITQNLHSYLWEYAEQMSNRSAGTLKVKVERVGQQTIKRTQLDGTLSDPTTRTTDATISDPLEINVEDIGMANRLANIFAQYDNKFKNYYDSLKNDTEKIRTVSEKLREGFKLHENIKGYISTKNDLEIVNERNLLSLGGELREMASHFYKAGQDAINTDSSNTAGLYRGEHLGRAFDSLIFMLNNTVDGAAFCEDRELVKSLISYNCCIWLWDGMSASMKDIENEVNGDNVLHIFQSGGAYYTVSDILYQIVDIFEQSFKGNPVKNWMTTKIKYGISLAEATSKYQELKSTYPYRAKDEEGKDIEPQKQLKQRWDEIRNIGIKETKLTVHINQKALDKLLGRLSLLRIKG